MINEANGCFAEYQIADQSRGWMQAVGSGWSDPAWAVEKSGSLPGALTATASAPKFRHDGVLGR